MLNINNIDNIRRKTLKMNHFPICIAFYCTFSTVFLDFMYTQYPLLYPNYSPPLIHLFTYHPAMRQVWKEYVPFSRPCAYYKVIMLATDQSRRHPAPIHNHKPAEPVFCCLAPATFNNGNLFSYRLARRSLSRSWLFLWLCKVEYKQPFHSLLPSMSTTSTRRSRRRGSRKVAVECCCSNNNNNN